MMPYRHATQQAFLEAHERAFDHFGGVFRLLRYDNLASAVRKILRGHRREETASPKRAAFAAGFVAFRSHWRFAAEFCTPGEGHEKGGVEGEGGYFRRNHLVPVPSMADLDALNALLLAGCREDEARVLDGRTDPVGAAMALERAHLLPCAAEGFDLAEIAFPLVEKRGCVAVKTNLYSVPVKAGTRVEARVHPLHVEVWHAGRRIARHERCHSRASRCWTSSTILMCWGTSPARWPGPSRWNNGARPGGGPPALTSLGTGCRPGTASRTAPAPWWAW